MKKVLIILLTFSASLYGQDAHFSSPMHVATQYNPAQTGLFSGCYRIATNYRNQWLSTGAPFNTYLVALDEPVKISQNSRQKLGVGFHLLQEVSAGQLIKHTDIKLNIAYHRYLDYDYKHLLSGGFHAGILQTKLNINDIGFEEQYNSVSAIDLDRNNGESFITGNIFAFDINIGALYQYKVKGTKIQSGLTINHINRPYFSVFNIENDSTRMNIKHNFNFLYQKDLSKKSRLTLSTANHVQGGYSVILFGGSLMYRDFLISGEKNTIEFGVFHRIAEAIILNFRTKYNNHIINFNYDITVSGYVRATQSFGAFEIGYTRSIQCKPEIPSNCSRPCLRL